MKKIYVFPGGGQRVRQDGGDTFSYKIVESSDWPEKSQSCGQSNYTRIWNTDFTSFKKEVEAWAGRRVKLCLSEEEFNCTCGTKFWWDDEKGRVVKIKNAKP